MVSKFTLLSNIFLVSIALAVSPSHLGARFPPGEDLQLQRSNSSALPVDITFNDIDNWAGGVLVKDAGTFNTVTGTFTVPTVTGFYLGASAFIGIGMDGNSCAGVILRVGIHIRVIDGRVLFNALYQWYPDHKPQYFPPTSILSGDVITLTVTAIDDNTAGVVVFMNHRNEWLLSTTLRSSHALCGQDAEWTVVSSKQLPFRLPNFGSVTFSNAFASGITGTGIALTPHDATLVNIPGDGKSLTETSVDESDMNNILLTVKYNV